MIESGTTPEHARLDTLLREHGALQSAAELHGFLAGQLAAGRRFSREQWLSAAAAQADLDQQPDAAAADDLFALYQWTLAALAGSDFAFAPVLVTDAEPLPTRLTSLGAWCQGFLGGFGLGGGSADDAETQDALRDIAAVAQIGTDEEESEDSDSDLFAVTEYVRLAVINMFWQRNADTAAAPTVTPASSTTPTVSTGPAPPASPADLFRRGKLH